MVRRDFLIRSALPPEAVLAVLVARGREWRESMVPAALREHGIHGVHIRIDGTHFRIRSEASWTDRFDLRCQGVVSPDTSGSVIRGSIRQDNPPLWIGLFLIVVVAISVALNPTGETAGAGLTALAAWGLIGGLMLLLGPKRARHDAEAAEFERILEAAAWPPGKSPSAQVAV
jgi:hypothetical protein